MIIKQYACQVYRFFLAAFLLLTLTVAKAQTATVENVWIDHNVMENGEMGMRIHTKIFLNGSKGRTFRMGVCHYFMYSDGTPLKSNIAPYYNTADNQVCVWSVYQITPEWDPTYYNDWYVFFPYRAIPLGSGNYNLKFATLIRDDSNGRWIQKQAVHTNFVFNVPGTPSQPSTPGVNPYYNPSPERISCGVCSGTGRCSNCGGSGKSPYNVRTTPCGACGGSGRCNTCRGTGYSGTMY